MKKKVEIEEQRQARTVPSGEFCRFVFKTGKISSKVYIMRDYDRSSRKYFLQNWDDVSDGRFVSPGQLLLVGFTF